MKEGEDEKDKIKASLSALFILSAPFTMMIYSIFTFLLGLAIYHGFSWTRALDPSAGKNDSRDVFITFVVGAGFCQGLFTTASFAKVIETLILPSRLQSAASRTNRGESLQSGYKIEGVPGSGVGRLEHARRDASDSKPLQREQISPSEDIEAVSHEALPLHKRQGVDELIDGGLTVALQAAADAHLQCAEADRRVAFEYAKLS